MLPPLYKGYTFENFHFTEQQTTKSMQNVCLHTESPMHPYSIYLISIIAGQTEAAWNVEWEVWLTRVRVTSNPRHLIFSLCYPIGLCSHFFSYVMSNLRLVQLVQQPQYIIVVVTLKIALSIKCYAKTSMMCVSSRQITKQCFFCFVFWVWKIPSEETNHHPKTTHCFWFCLWFDSKNRRVKFVMEFSYLEKRKEGSPLHPLAEDTPKRAT